MKPDLDYFPDVSDDFFLASGFPQCGIKLDAGKLMNAARRAINPVIIPQRSALSIPSAIRGGALQKKR